MIDARGNSCYNYRHMKAPALYLAAGGVRHDGVNVMASPIVIPPCDSANLKRCTKCGIEYPATSEYFHRDGKKLRANCKACVRDYFQANADHIHEQKREYMREYTEINSERIREYQRKRTAEKTRIRRENRPVRERLSPEQLLENARAYKKRNAERIAKSKRDYWQTPEGKAKHREYKLRRRARKLALLSTYTAADWQIALDYFGGGCAACGRQQGLWHTLAADHWIPLSKGGPTTPDNIVPLCHGVGGCNNSKRDRDAAEWLISTFGKRKARAIQQRIEAYLKSRQPVLTELG